MARLQETWEHAGRWIGPDDDPEYTAALEAGEGDIEYKSGAFNVVGTDRRMSLFDVAARAKEMKKKGEITEDLVVDSVFTDGAERVLAEDVLDGLTKPFKELPPKHFYDARGSELFDRIEGSRPQ